MRTEEDEAVINARVRCQAKEITVSGTDQEQGRGGEEKIILLRMTNSLWQGTSMDGSVWKCGNIWQPYVAILRGTHSSSSIPGNRP